MKYRVTIARYGWLYVEADNPAEAMDLADHQRTDTVSWSDDWAPTDADPADEIECKTEHFITERAF